MLLSKDAVAEVVEILRGADFYRPAHETIFDAIIDLYGRGEPVDAVTVADHLSKRGQLSSGGWPVPARSVSGRPAGSKRGFYAKIVRDRAVRRRLADAGTRVVQLAHAGEGEVGDLVDRAKAELYAVTDGRAGQDCVALSQLMEPVMDEIEAIGARGELSGVPTGFAELDQPPAAYTLVRW